MWGAGSGKTWSLMRAAEQVLADRPLGEGQKILALTFMQGARRRVEGLLSTIVGLNGHYTCETLDSFARHLVSRWRSLSQHLGFAFPLDEDHDGFCAVAAALLQRQEVVEWVARVYCLLIIDEAQDMDEIRLGVVKGLAERIDTLAAADEFQCLNESIVDSPTCRWLSEVAEQVELVEQRRTADVEILTAAAALRSGRPLPAGKSSLRVLVTGNAKATADQINNWLGWFGRRPRRTAVITPWISPYTKSVLEYVRTSTSKRKMGRWKAPIRSC